MGRLVVILLWIAAMAAFAMDVVRNWPAIQLFRQGGDPDFVFASTGELWFRYAPGSLNLIQVIVQRYLWPPLWEPGIVTLLIYPAWSIIAALAALATLLMWNSRRRSRLKF